MNSESSYLRPNVLVEPPPFDSAAPKNGSSSPSTAAGPNVYTAAGCVAQSPVGRSAEQLRGTMKLGLPRCSGVSNCRVSSALSRNDPDMRSRIDPPARLGRG